MSATFLSMLSCRGDTPIATLPTNQVGAALALADAHAAVEMSADAPDTTGSLPTCAASGSHYVRDTMVCRLCFESERCVGP